MSDLVIDSSAALELLINGPLAPAVQDAIKGYDLVVPAHFHAEVLGAIASLTIDGTLSEEEADAAIEKLVTMPVTAQLPTDTREAWGKAGECDVVDALYVVLADWVEGPLVTLNADQAAATVRAVLVAS